MAFPFIFEDLGLIDYQQAFQIQETLFNEKIRLKIEQKNSQDSSFKNTHHLLFCEHFPVFTLGKSGLEKNLLVSEEELNARKISLFKTNRGGDITFHGPGQLVGYPIFDLDEMKIGIRQYIDNIEETIILSLLDYGIKGERINGASGVWIKSTDNNFSKKICSLGVRVSRGITMHGFALNINTDLNYFKYINPCGFSASQMTSVSAEKNAEQNMDEFKMNVLKNLKKVFHLQS